MERIENILHKILISCLIDIQIQLLIFSFIQGNDAASFEVQFEVSNEPFSYNTMVETETGTEKIVEEDVAIGESSVYFQSNECDMDANDISDDVSESTWSHGVDSIVMAEVRIEIAIFSFF